ncbi:MAG TPA: hypothetical protein VIF83_11730 [Gemmatimonadaceae bacterium]|jgi:hypothetical protein
MAAIRGERPRKGEWNDGEFEDFLAEIVPTLEASVGRLGVAGHLSARTEAIDQAKTILVWLNVSDRIIEELR